MARANACDAGVRALGDRRRTWDHRTPSARITLKNHCEAESRLRQESGREREEHAGAVTRAVIRRHGSPVPDTTQGLEEGVEHCP